MVLKTDPTMTMVQRRRFTRNEYHRMGEAGILGPDERVELVDGEIVLMGPIGDFHADETTQVAEVLPRAVGDRARLWVQNPIVLDPHWEPQPDFCLVRRRSYRGGKPGPEDIFLAVEIADTSLASDRDVKIPRYGSAGILEAWLVDLNNRRIFVFRDPFPEGYRSVQIFEAGSRLSLVAFPDVDLAFDDLLPPA